MVSHSQPPCTATFQCFVLSCEKVISVRDPAFEPRINAVKRLAVSTGPLRRLLALHVPPIYLVVFQEPMFINEQET